MCPLNWTAIAAVALGLLVCGEGVQADPIRMEALGVYCEGCDETTPVLWPPGPTGKLTVVEHHSGFRIRSQAHDGIPGAPNNDVILPLIPGSTGIAFASALVVNNTLWVFGTNDVEMDGGKPRTQVHIFWSSDPSLSSGSWNTTSILQLPQTGVPNPKDPPYIVPWWTAFNTSPTKGVVNGRDAYVLAVELGSPTVLIGERFTSVFAVCYSCASTDDLSTGWEVLDPTTHIYEKSRYSACPTLRYFGGYFYVVTLFENVPNPAGPACNSDSKVWSACLAGHIVRSKDLQTWEESPYAGGLIMGLPDGKNTSGPDHHIIANSYLDQTGDAVTKAWARNQTDDVNRSDMDMVDLPDGTTYVVWGTGNQGVATPPNPPIGFSGAGIVKATQQQWLESFF